MKSARLQPISLLVLRPCGQCGSQQESPSLPLALRTESYPQPGQALEAERSTNGSLPFPAVINLPASATRQVDGGAQTSV